MSGKVSLIKKMHSESRSPMVLDIFRQQTRAQRSCHRKLLYLFAQLNKISNVFKTLVFGNGKGGKEHMIFCMEMLQHTPNEAAQEQFCAATLK